MANPSKWTFESIQKEALRYTTRTAFQKGFPSAYQTARKNGWLDKVCSHMPTPKPKNSWTFENVKNEALNYETRMSFSKNSRSAYSTAQQNGWLDDVCSHMSRPAPVRKWTFEDVKNEALNYENRKTFFIGSCGAYNAALRNGWLDEMCSHMSRPAPANKKWTYEAVKNKALCFQSRYAFQKGFRSAYQAARENGWLDDVCAHMQRKPRTKWTLESIHKEALNYQSRSAFKKGSRNAYQSARRRGWLDAVCSHMKKLIHYTEQKTD